MKIKFKLLFLLFFLNSIISGCPAEEKDSDSSGQNTKNETPLEQPNQDNIIKNDKKTNIRYINGLNVNVRLNSDISSEILETVDINTSAELTGNSQKKGENVWTQLKLPDGKKGWVLEKFLSETKITNRIFFQDKCVLVSEDKICVGDTFENIKLKYTNFDTKKFENGNKILIHIYINLNNQFSGVLLSFSNNIVEMITVINDENIPSNFLGKTEHGLGIGSSLKDLDTVLLKHYDLAGDNMFYCFGYVDYKENIECLLDMNDLSQANSIFVHNEKISGFTLKSDNLSGYSHIFEDIKNGGKNNFMYAPKYVFQ